MLNEWKEKFSERKEIYTMVSYKTDPYEKPFLAFPLGGLYTQV